MTTLEDAIRAAAASGKLHGVTLFANSEHGWQGNARWNSDGWSVFVDRDPVVALTKAIMGATNFDPANPVRSAPAIPDLPPEAATKSVFD